MTEIAILFDRSETDELGIKLTAEEMGIHLGYLPFHKVAVNFGKSGLNYRSIGRDYSGVLNETKVVLNRTQSKSRRIFATTLLEGIGKEVLNPLVIESACQSKIRTLIAFYKTGIAIPETVFIPCNVKEVVHGGCEVDNTKILSELIVQQLGIGKIVVKPDAGTHGKGVSLIEGPDGLKELLSEISPSIINPSGVVAQEFIPKGFFDLRIVISKEYRGSFKCQPTAMARAGFKDFRTNTYLGNMVFRVNLPMAVRREAKKCGEAIGASVKAGVVALDAMPSFGEEPLTEEKEIKACFDSLEKPFGAVKKSKNNPYKKKNFESYTRNVEDAYDRYMSTEAYAIIQKHIQDKLDNKKDSIVFHEGNSCPEFWEQTRIVGGINVGELLLRSAQSLLDS